MSSTLKKEEYPRLQQREETETLGEVIANSITHGIGAALSIAGLAILVLLAALKGDVWRIVSFSVYGTTLVVLYLASTLYHSFQNPKVKHLFKIIDHAAIYLLIAGTYTPFMLVSLRGAWGWTLFGIIWGLALSGIVFKAFYIHRFTKLSVVFYILMGWLCVLALKKMQVSIPLGGLVWLAVGGVLYTVGIIFYAWQGLKYSHAIWHLFVLGGSICHYFSILLYVLPEV
ncbi:MAG: hemolysin III family protein [bacterium]